MHRRFLLILVATVAMMVCTEAMASEPALLIGQSGTSGRGHGPGGYISWLKLLLLTIGFFTFVRLTDWMNRDSQKIGKAMGQLPEFWNPISLVSFLIGFWAAVSIPIFLAGFPVFLVGAFGPFTTYYLIRRKKFIETPSLANKLLDGPEAIQKLPQDEGIEIKFSPAGDSDEQKQRNLIRARQVVAFGEMKELIAGGAEKRAEVIVLDYNRNQVAGQMMIDGSWHALPLMTREIGDSILVGLKSLAGLNPADRRNRQQGQFGAGVSGKKVNLDLISQGTQTGERVQMKFVEKRKHDFTLSQLGMWPEMAEQLVGHTSQPGLVLVSSPPRQGLTASWRAVLGASDRITRDWISLVDPATTSETDVENVVLNTFATDGESPNETLRKLLLSQPDALVMPDIITSDFLDLLTDQAQNQQRTVVTRSQARSAADALVGLCGKAGDKRRLAATLKCATGQRLARRLCDRCKVAVRVKPELIQRLGGDPRKSNTLYNPYVLPPVEQRVDENGKPIEMEPCKACAGIGYIGRISIFEIINVNAKMREVLVKNPNTATIRKLATAAGDLPMMQQGFRLALLGITSVAEVQRVMKD